MSVHDSIAFMAMHIPGISFPLFVSWLCLDGQSAMNICGLGLYNILMLDWTGQSAVVFLEPAWWACKFFFKIATSNLVVHYYADFAGEAVVMKFF